MDNSKKSPTLLSLCTGYGGLELGIERAIGPLNVLAHVEIEAYAVANLVAKMEAGQMDPAPIWTDLKTLPVEPFRDRVDILTGGYPCQPFSAAGRRQGDKDPRHLWPHIRRLVRAIRPGICFFENVEGHISLGLSTVISDLEEDGYRTTWGIFSASEVGAPHQRKRVFIMADRKQSGLEGHAGNEHGTARPEGTGADRPTGEGGLPLADPESGDTFWSAGPGQPQHDWEEPRTIEPGLGGAIDGPGSRVDRLRLLGNGVVPQTAEKAFRVLMDRFAGPGGE